MPSSPTRASVFVAVTTTGSSFFVSWAAAVPTVADAASAATHAIRSLRRIASLLFSAKGLEVTLRRGLLTRGSSRGARPSHPRRGQWLLPRVPAPHSQWRDRAGFVPASLTPELTRSLVRNPPVSLPSAPAARYRRRAARPRAT